MPRRKVSTSLVQDLSSKKTTLVRTLVLIQYFIDGFKEWKMKTFMLLGAEMDHKKITNIIAIGDSQIEIDAANQLAE